MELKVDFLVIGSGLAGLSYALKVADKGKVLIITKDSFGETSTNYAQGGIAIVTDESDSYAKHVEDTIDAGDEIGEREIVEMVVKRGPHELEELVKWGAEFDKTAEGNYDLAKEGGHSEKRILHKKDKTGFEIQSSLEKAIRANENIEVIENCFAIDIITQHHLGQRILKGNEDIECFGVYAFDNNEQRLIKILSKITYMATGGMGMVYQTTTNPKVATGDGIAMVYRAKGKISDMEFVQFHPTAFFMPGKQPTFLITEAIRGFGAVLKTNDDEEFMQKYDARGCLAPRDIVARAIDNELKISGEEHVGLDCRDLNQEELRVRFPNIVNFCNEMGIDVSKEKIPVIPAMHYLCGGIIVDKKGKTTIGKLYAGGECTRTGMHGANRLASNSLLEAIVYSGLAAEESIMQIGNIEIVKDIPDWDDSGTTHPEEMVLITQSRKELQQIMSNYVGIVRSNLRLKRARERLEIIYRETEDLYKRSKVSKKICELRNMINVAYLIIRMAQARKESRGLHYNIDYPFKKTVEE